MPLLPAHLFVGIIADFTRQTSIDDNHNPPSNSGIKTSQGWPVYDYESGFALFIPLYERERFFAATLLGMLHQPGEGIAYLARLNRWWILVLLSVNWLRCWGVSCKIANHRLNILIIQVLFTPGG